MSVDMIDYMVDLHHIDIDPEDLKKVKVKKRSPVCQELSTMI